MTLKARPLGEQLADVRERGQWRQQPVGELLTASLSAHQAAREARRQKDGVTALAAVRSAYDLRLTAEAVDPEHTDPAWAGEQAVTISQWDTHAVLMTFYRQQLGLS